MEKITLSIQIKNIGIPGVKQPEKSCENDPNCPFHGTIKLRGRILTGKVVSTKMHNTIVIKRDFEYYVPKYERYERRNSKIAAHLPECIEVKDGDTVRIAQCRRISKTVAFVVIEKIEEGDL
ncbi:MAG: 30S ribosomal protein S17 [Promethearchaeota archaeon]